MKKINDTNEFNALKSLKESVTQICVLSILLFFGVGGKEIIFIEM